jgi:hypothetical protein
MKVGTIMLAVIERPTSAVPRIQLLLTFKFPPVASAVAYEKRT